MSGRHGKAGNVMGEWGMVMGGEGREFGKSTSRKPNVVGPGSTDTRPMQKGSARQVCRVVQAGKGAGKGGR